MPSAYLERQLAQRGQLRADAQSILDQAAQENRDVTDAERDVVETAYREIDELDKRIRPLHDAELRQATHDKQVADLERATRARRETAGTPGSGGALDMYRGNVGAYLADWGNQPKDPAARQRIARAHAEYRVVADQKLADNPGIVPTVVVGDVSNTLNTARPFIDSVTQRPMPAGGSSFNRPRITQHVTVGVQATEKTQLSSQKMTIDSVPVAKKTFGGTLDISFQDRDWTDPAILAIAVADLAGVYAKETDNYAADSFVTATTNTFVLGASPASGEVRSAVLNTANQIAADIGVYPDTVWMAPDVQAQLGAIVETGSAGLPSFPGLSQVGSGGELMGLRAVTDANFAAGTMIIGASGWVEHYETVGGLLSVTEPTILGYTIAYYGYTADLLVNALAARKRALT